MPETPTPFIHQFVASLARRTPGLDGPPPAVHAVPLRPEDRPDFEHLLDEALILAPPPGPLTPEQVRTMAVGANAAINATAAAEYAEYVGIREAGSGSSGEEEAQSADGQAGMLAVLAVLLPVLSGTASLVFLGVGYGLRIADAGSGVAGHLVDIGWFFLALTAVTFVATSVALLLTALRRPAPSVAVARAAWQAALLEHGVKPFLHEVYQVQAARAPDRPPLAPERRAGSAGQVLPDADTG